MLTRVPVVRSVYSVFKQLRDVFQNNSAGQYKEVVMVEYPTPGTWAIAFVAGQAKGEMRHRLGEEYIGVFLPTTPNPTSGFLLYVKASNTVKLDMTVEEGAKVIFSGGLVVPDFPPDSKSAPAK